MTAIRNRLKTACVPVVALALFWLAGCSTPDQSRTGVARFRHASSANVVLKFGGWDCTLLARPVYAENGFMEPVRRDTLDGILDRLNVRRDLAVVVVGWNHQPDELQQLVGDWKAVLSGCGFRRVVIVRAQPGGELNGSIVVDDSQISGIQAPAA
jgi:hypothetical protein